VSGGETSPDANFLGMRFAALNMVQAVDSVRFASEGNSWRYVVTPNAAHFARLSESDRFLQDIYQNAYLCFLDSRVISLVARICGMHPPPVVPGSDLVEQIFRKAITPLDVICVVGSTKLVVKKIKDTFNVGEISHVDPSVGFWRNQQQLDEAAAFVVASKADYTFLVVGSPQQEILAARIAAIGGARGVGICGGASIDFITGGQKRAPHIMQRLALEWAYRLWMEPQRLAYRYMVESPRGVLFVLRKAFGYNSNGG
jgi:N-acetylglucosaminyldiphosphoundecaprenol N-acetyl-beta-D-mannosaminyltransferase